jgi:hypothetical protein
MPIIIFGVPCNQCGKAISLSDAPFCGSQADGYKCFECQAKHRQAMAFLTDRIAENYTKLHTNECEVCLKTLDQIEDLTGRRSLFFHWKDGILQKLCKPCSDAYEQSNRQLYRGTKYGHIKNIF